MPKLFLGYYFSDGKLGDYSAECWPYTNTYLSWARMQYSNYGSEPNSTWRASMRKLIKRAYKAGKYIYLQLNMQDPRDAAPDFVNRVLETIAAPVWDKVVAVELADEPNWGSEKTTVQRYLKSVAANISALGLGKRPLGITYTTDRGLSEDPRWRDTVTLPQFGFVGLECYLPLTPPSVKASVPQMQQNVRRHRSFLPTGQKVWLTMMGYTRNKSLTVAQTLPAQDACYGLAKESDRTLGMTIFSYGRPSGTFEYPKLQAEHKRISADMKARGIYA